MDVPRSNVAIEVNLEIPHIIFSIMYNNSLVPRDGENFFSGLFERCASPPIFWTNAPEVSD